MFNGQWAIGNRQWTICNKQIQFAKNPNPQPATRNIALKILKHSLLILLNKIQAVAQILK
jgi:hypothetical protein